MKITCPECKRIVGINKNDGNSLVPVHRVKRGRKNKLKETRHPYCNTSRKPVTTDMRNG